jgi:uncharacterized protein (DUF924 family)
MNQHNRTAPRADAVLSFWFGTLEAGFASAANRKRWFAPDPEFDRAVATQFGDLLDSAATGALNHWHEDARGRLAFIIVTDQFSRQIHRGSARAFATDAIALRAARDGIERSHDRALQFDERTFFYLPFEHAESNAAQDTSVALFSTLRDSTPLPYRALTEDTLRFAEQHREIVRRFGRFPHRNVSLGRASTADELEFLRSASRFGQ